MPHAVIVGGGVIGASCAYYLARSGWQVTVVDRGSFGMGCSHGNCGFVCPSHVLPMAEPGAIQMALRSLFRKSSPFYIKPRLEPALWSWLWHFARRCNHRDMLTAGNAIHALLQSSMKLYQQLIAEERLDCEWETRGLLYVYRTPEEWEKYAAVDELLREHFHEPAVRVTGDELAAREPALKPGLAGAWYYPGDAHLRPDKLMASWRRVLEKAGVAFRENEDVTGWSTGGSGKPALATSRGEGELRADAFVFATGALTPRLRKLLGCRIPIEPGKGYSITMPRPALCPATPLIFPEHRVAITPMQSGYRIGSTMEFAGYDTTINRRRLDLLRQGASHYLREPYSDPVEEEWFGWRPMTYDSLPIIDRSPKLDNVWIAAGHNMLGLSMAPSTGKLMAELLCGVTPHIDPEPYRVTRF
jgi:D-amino-acid dehydrogenase